MTKSILAVVLALGGLGVFSAPARACDCQKQGAPKQCTCAGGQCPGPCGGETADASQPKQKKPKPDKK
jgi:hypothetical protein